MTLTVPSVRLLRQPVLAALEAVTNLKVYDGRIDQHDPPEVIPGSAGQVAAYAVLYAGGGLAYLDRMAGRPSALLWRPSVTVAAGYLDDCLAAVDRVREALSGLPVAPPDGQASYLREEADPGNVRVDEQLVPPRFWLPVNYTTVTSL